MAWTCCDYADILLERNCEGDREKSSSLLEESLAISSELGMRPLIAGCNRAWRDWGHSQLRNPIRERSGIN